MLQRDRQKNKIIDGYEIMTVITLCMWLKRMHQNNNNKDDDDAIKIIIIIIIIIIINNY